MWVRVSCELSFELSVPTPFNLMLRPRSNSKQWIENDHYEVRPNVPVSEFSDSFGNLTQRLVAPVGHFEVKTSAVVRTQDQVDSDQNAPFITIEDLPNEVLKYLSPSRYCESDRFGELASSIIKDEATGYNQVLAIESWLKKNIAYLPGSSSYPLSAIEVNYNQSGVCRDLAHLGIALCRSISIPARMVAGYLLDLKPMDMHAWFEAYIGNKWYTFDATQLEEKGGYVAVSFGKDASDIPLYNQFGPSVFPIYQNIDVELYGHHISN